MRTAATVGPVCADTMDERFWGMRIILDNFQIVKHAEVNVRGITLVTGPNDSGKSSLIRALKAFSTGQGSPDLIRRGAKSARVIVEAGGRVFVWNRLADTVTYEIDGVGHKKLNKKSLQDVIPDSPLRYEDVGGDRVFPQILSQGEHPFPFGLGEATIYKLFSRFLGVGTLRDIQADLTEDLKALSKGLTAKNAEVEILTVQQTRREGLLAALPDPAMVRGWLTSYRSLERALASASGHIARLDSWACRLHTAEHSLNHIENVMKQYAKSYLQQYSDKHHEAVGFRVVELTLSSHTQSLLNQHSIVVQLDRFIRAREDHAKKHRNLGPVVRKWLPEAERGFNHFHALRKIVTLSHAHGSIERKVRELNDYRHRLNQHRERISTGFTRLGTLKRVTGDLSRLGERLDELASERVALMTLRDGCNGGLAEFSDCPLCNRPFASDESGDKLLPQMSHVGEGRAFGVQAGVSPRPVPEPIKRKKKAGQV